MNELEKDIRETLRRRAPPSGFVQRTLARKREQDAHRKALEFWRWATLSVVLVASTGLVVYRQHLRQVEGVRAKEQVLFALRLSGSELRSMQERMNIK